MKTDGTETWKGLKNIIELFEIMDYNDDVRDV